MAPSTSDPTISVIVPVYNKRDSLRRALQSIFEQSQAFFEIIIVDDASTDGSHSLIEQYADHGRIKVVTRDEPGAGGYAARNAGAQIATGQWLAFVDADDYLDISHVSELKEAIHRYPETRFIVTRHAKVTRDGVAKDEPVLHSGKVDRLGALQALVRSDFITMNSVAIERTKFLELGGFPEGWCRRGGDVYFWFLAVSKLPHLVYVNRITSYWVIGTGGVTSNPKNLCGVHPAVSMRKFVCAELSEKELRLLGSAINRKVLGWAAEKRIYGLPVSSDLAQIQWSSLTVSQLGRCLALLLPLSLYRAATRWRRAAALQRATRVR